MKTRIFIAFVLLAVSLIPMTTAKAEDPRIYFTGIACTRLAEGDGEYVEHGWIGHMTGLRDQYDYLLSDERVSGLGYVTINFTWRVGPDGPLWGSIEIVNDGGTWIGQWNGISDNGGYTIRGILIGSGEYEGMVAYYHQYRPIPQECMDINGYIVDTSH